MTTEQEKDWVAEIGKPAYEGIAEMVACLTANRERLEELRDELTEAFDDQAEQNNPNDSDAMLEWIKSAADEGSRHPFQDSAQEYLELLAAVTIDGEELDEEEIRERIQEDPLSVEVRSGWYTPGSEDREPVEFCILLSTGGPAVRIIGELDEHGQPSRAWLEVQDWFKPWTEYLQCERDTLLTYAQQFYFGE